MKPTRPQSKTHRPESKANSPSNFPSSRLSHRQTQKSPAQSSKREGKPQSTPESTIVETNTRPIKTADFAAQYSALSKKRRQRMLDQFGALIVRPDPTLDLPAAPCPPRFDPHAPALRAKCMRKAQQWIHNQQPAQRPATRAKLENAIKCLCFTNAALMTVPFLLARLFSEAHLAVDANGYFVFPLMDAKRKEFRPIDRFDLPAFALDLHEMQLLAIDKAFRFVCSLVEPPWDLPSLEKSLVQFCQARIVCNPKDIVSDLVARLYISVEGEAVQYNY